MTEKDQKTTNGEEIPESGMPKKDRTYVRITNRDKFIVFEEFVDKYVLYPRPSTVTTIGTSLGLGTEPPLYPATEEIILYNGNETTHYYMMPGDLIEITKEEESDG